MKLFRVSIRLFPFRSGASRSSRCCSPDLPTSRPPDLPTYCPLGTGDGGSDFTRALNVWKFRESTVSERRIAGS
jgi:hypothetical protein